ncbi:MAG: branched-chain amino acid ABC transporter permease, partial [Actinomycetota bacterium]|nr:branched-chain amino acid ABC transporter permease [Actinomycetota bacterium]
GRLSGISLPPVPSWRRSALCGGLFVLAVYVLTGALSEADTSRFGQALCLSLVMLSLVVLTGYGGDVSLCQMSFVGVGGLVVGRMFDGITPVSLVAAFLVAGLLGACIAVPALRLRGLYLGLGTLAVAAAMDNLVFPTSVFGFGAGGGSLVLDRPSPLGVSLESERAFTVTVALAFVAMSLAVLSVRRGRFGRLLLAARDSDAACATLGFSPTAIRVLVFGISAGLAGIAGAFYAGMRVSIGTADFTFFASLPLLLLAVVGGVTSVTGALVGGIALGLLPVVQEQYPAVGGLIFVGVLIAVVSLGGNPNGLAGRLFALRPAPPPSASGMAPAGHRGGALVGSA